MTGTSKSFPPDIGGEAIIYLTTREFEPDFLLNDMLEGRGDAECSHKAVLENRLKNPREPLRQKDVAELMKAAMEKYGLHEGDIKYNEKEGRFSITKQARNKIRGGQPTPV
ncbi:MAG: hypothetical protein PHY92_07005 [Alphaproteobacteria bacterium]|nr:hypothetical protein [Alphaproteobacteria bacterium]